MKTEYNPGVVLYVEDEETDALFMQRAFHKAEIEHLLHVVRDGQQALDYLSGACEYADRQRHPLPALVLLDLNLPVLSGFEVLQWMRLQPDLSTLPVVIFSSSTRPDDQRKAMELGANDYVQKPASGTGFIDVITRLRGEWPSPAAGSPAPSLPPPPAPLPDDSR